MAPAPRLALQPLRAIELVAAHGGGLAQPHVACGQFIELCLQSVCVRAVWGLVGL